MPLNAKGLFAEDFQYHESRGRIPSDKQEAIEAAKKSLRFNRKQLLEHIEKDGRFLYSLEPIEVQRGPQVVRHMAAAATKAGVGPMAAVAGVLADLAVQDMVEVGAAVAVVENGGEASLVSDRSLDVALLAGTHPVSGRFVFEVDCFPTGIATSSAVFSHALSFGEAEAVTIFSSNAGLADAAATAVCNRVNGLDRRKVARSASEYALSIEGVLGVIIVYGGVVARAGDVPDLAEVHKGTQTGEEC